MKKPSRMALGDPGRIEAEALSMDDLRGRQPVTLGGVRLIEQAREEARRLGDVPVVLRPSS